MEFTIDSLPGHQSAAGRNVLADKCQQKHPMLRILSYNIRHGQGMDGKINLKRIADVITKENPDLVALQEVDKWCTRSGNRDLAKELGALLNMEHQFGNAMDFQGGEYGNAVLSRLPIIETILHQFPKGEKEDVESRCALEVKIQAKGFPGPLSFISIHLDMGYEAVRKQQVETQLNALRNTKNPIILAGDFNGEKTDASLKTLEAQEWMILDEGGKKTYPSDTPTVEIDFFALRGFPKIAIQHDVIDERMASDHRPITAVITLQN